MEREWIWRRWQYDSADGVINLFTNTDMSDISWMQHLPIFSMKQSVAKMFGYVLKGLLVLPFISDHRSLLAGKWSQQSETDKDWSGTHLWAGSQRLLLAEGRKVPWQNQTGQLNTPHLLPAEGHGELCFLFPRAERGLWWWQQCPQPVSDHACSTHALPPQPWGWLLLPWAQPDSVSCLLLWGHSQPRPRTTEYFRLD